MGSLEKIREGKESSSFGYDKTQKKLEKNKAKDTSKKNKEITLWITIFLKKIKQNLEKQNTNENG